MAVLVGVGAAAAAMVGRCLERCCLNPRRQLMCSIWVHGWHSNVFVKLVEGSVMLLGTVLTLAAFHFSVGRAPDGTPKPQSQFSKAIAWFGRIFIAITLGVLVCREFTWQP